MICYYKHRLFKGGWLLILLQQKHSLPSTVNPPLSNSGNPHQMETSKLKDQESSIVSHVQAHLSSGGSLVSSPSYLYTTSKDGRRFISSGDVSFKAFGMAGDPSLQLYLAKAIQKVALAPRDPTPRDRSISILAQALESFAQKSLKEQDSTRLGTNIDTQV